MKTRKTIRKIPQNPNQFFKGMRVVIVLSVGLGSVTQPVWSERSTPDVQNAQAEPAKKPGDGQGRLPTFAEADVNGDHYVTKSELQNFPFLLQVFDKVDAGEDGKLEQHEYLNLKMETKREGEVK
jgi:hypothetical protein